MKKILSILVLASMLAASCKKEETTDAAPPEETTVDTTAVNTTDSLATAGTTTPQVEAVASNGPTTGSVLTTQPGVTAKSYTTTPVPTAKGMNPAHGQPGHRCDIAVGAPLNSAPAKNASTPATVTQATTVTPAMMGQTVTAPPATVAAPATPVVTAPGMNPPHGEEGHDCAVAVGAPLPKK